MYTGSKPFIRVYYLFFKVLCFAIWIKIFLIGGTNMLKYYCYISQNKIDNLYMQTKSGNVEKKEIQKKIDLDISADTSKDRFSILSFLGTDLSYGANGVIQFNKSEKIQYARKLEEILRVLEKENQIQYLNSNVPSFQLNSLYYYTTARFRVADSSNVIEDHGFVDGIVKIESDTVSENGIKLSFACSMKYFSDTRSNGKYMIHSGNYYFFKENTKVKFDTVFMLTNFDAEEKIIYGSPLFLAISQDCGGHL